jgi:hypothetical protein
LPSRRPKNPLLLRSSAAVPCLEPEAGWRVEKWPLSPVACIREKPMLISVLVTFLVVILILYLINLLPLDGRAKQIVRVIVIILGVISLLKYIAVF